MHTNTHIHTGRYNCTHTQTQPKLKLREITWSQTSLHKKNICTHTKTQTETTKNREIEMPFDKDGQKHIDKHKHTHRKIDTHTKKKTHYESYADHTYARKQSQAQSNTYKKRVNLIRNTHTHKHIQTDINTNTL